MKLSFKDLFISYEQIQRQSFYEKKLIVHMLLKNSFMTEAPII